MEDDELPPTREREALLKDLKELLSMSSREPRALLIARNVQAPGFPPTPDKLSAAELARRLDSALYSRSNISLQLTIWNYAAVELRALPHSELLRSGQGLEEWAEENDVILEDGWPKGLTWKQINKGYKSYQRDRGDDAPERTPQDPHDDPELDIEGFAVATLESISGLLSKLPRDLRSELLDRIKTGLDDLYSEADDDDEADDDQDW